MPFSQPTNIDCPKTCNTIKLNVYWATRIVYEVIKTYMLTNTPEQAGVVLKQTFDADYKKSGILLDMGYDWRTKDMSKVPAIFVQREEATYKTPTMGQHEGFKINKDNRFAICHLPVTISCVAAEPLTVVEQLAEYVKQPLLYFRNEIQLDYGIRRFQLVQMGKPTIVGTGKNNFCVDLTVNIDFDDQWVVQKDALKLKHINIELVDAQTAEQLETLDV